MQLEDRTECLTDLMFDRWFARELPPPQAAQLEGHVRDCTRCRLRRELLERERTTFLALAPTLEASAERIRQLRNISAPAARKRRTPSWLPLAAAATICSCMLAALLPAAEPSERRKGSFQLGFYVKRGAEIHRGTSGESVQPFDELGFRYTSSVPVYISVLGRDQHSASVYFPSARLAAGRELPLDFSLQLDATLGTELVFAVSCPAPFASERLREALQRTGTLEAPSGCRVERIELKKEAAR